MDEKTLSNWKNLQHCKSIMHKLFDKAWQTFIGLGFSVGDSVTLHEGLQLLLSKTIRIGYNKYHI